MPEQEPGENLNCQQLCPEGKCCVFCVKQSTGELKNKFCEGQGTADPSQTGGVPKKLTGTKKSNCLLEGDFMLSIEPLQHSVPMAPGSLNDWFGSTIRLSASSSNYGSNGATYFSSGTGVATDVNLFGFGFTFLEAELSRTVENGVADAQGPKYLILEGAIPIDNPKQQWAVDGPMAVIPIGPIPLTITSKISGGVDLGNFIANAQPLTGGCNGGAQTVVDLTGQALITAGASFNAAIEVLIATAGVTGKLMFADDTLTSSMKTVANPKANDITITPNISYHAEHFSGSLSAFVEVDVIFYSKKWSIDLFQ